MALPLGLILAAGLFQYFRPLPVVRPNVLLASRVTVPGSAPALPWPSGASALGAAGYGLIGAHGDLGPQPMWSVTKVMTARLVLKDHPLQKGEPGPSVPITDADVAEYQSMLAEKASVVPVEAGEQISEHQLIEALLIPSGNNIASILARWDAGSVATFVDRMNAEAKTLGLTHTTYADPAGFSEQSASVPADLVRLGMLEMRQPAFAEIVALPETTLPVAGRVFNTNPLLGQHGIAGIKTGHAPGVSATFLFDSLVTIGGRSIDLVGALMGQPGPQEAFAAAATLIDAATPAVRVIRVTAVGVPVVRYAPPWGGSVSVLAPSAVDLVGWSGTIAKVTTRVTPLDAPAPAGTVAGEVTIVLGDQRTVLNLTTSGDLQEPGKRWRLTRDLPIGGSG